MSMATTTHKIDCKCINKDRMYVQATSMEFTVVKYFLFQQMHVQGTTF